MGGAGTHEEV
jgi:chaperonin GroEL